MVDNNVGGVRAVANIGGKNIYLDKVSEKKDKEPFITRDVYKSIGKSVTPVSADSLIKDIYGDTWQGHDAENIYKSPKVVYNILKARKVSQNLYAEIAAAFSARTDFKNHETLWDTLGHLEGISLLDLNYEQSEAVLKVRKVCLAFPNLDGAERKERAGDAHAIVKALNLEASLMNKIDYSSILR